MWTVLLVEDEIFVRESLRKLIDWENEGFKVIGEAGNGKEAFQFIERYQPDLVISDILMPEMDGIELLKKVRGKGWNNLFLMLTVHTEFEYVRSAIELGASNYILKLSMTLESLVSTLRKTKEELIQNSKKQYIEMEGAYNKCWRRLLSEENKETDKQLMNELQKYCNKNLVVISTFNTDPHITEKTILDLLQSDRK